MGKPVGIISFLMTDVGKPRSPRSVPLQEDGPGHEDSKQNKLYKASSVPPKTSAIIIASRSLTCVPA